MHTKHKSSAVEHAPAGQKKQEEIRPRYTPGPWEIRPGSVDQVFAVGGDRICIAMPKRDEPHRDFEVDAANARLIAAAPDLLLALETVKGLAALVGVAAQSIGPVCDRAIAKAKGGAE